MNGTPSTKTSKVAEITLVSAPTYDNPFTDVLLDAEVIAPDGSKKLVPAFWAGDRTWKVRYASPLVGVHTFRTVCNRADDTGLHGLKGEINVTPYVGDNPLYRHGPIGISENHRHFEHHDGTPFLWLADTWWKALSKRLSWDGFQELCEDRKSKGFNAVQIVCGPYPDEEAFDPGWANEGGMMYGDRAFTRLNPAYFNYADRRLQLLVETGLVPVLVGAWGRADCDAMKVAGVEGLKRHWRYLVARYAAYPLVLVPGGEVPGVAKYGEGDWGEIVSYLCEIDPFKRIKTSHEYACPAREDAPLNDFEFVGGSHFSPKSLDTLKVFTDRYDQQPTMPLVCGETGYEGHMQRHFADTQRYVFWMYMLSGAAGHTYGAAGLHHMGVEGDPGLKPIWDWTTWQEAKEFAGATQVGMGAKLLHNYPWHRFEPHPEWSDQDCFAAGIPSQVRFIYRSNRSTYDWTGPRLKHLEEGIAYNAFYWDPATGRRFEQGIIRRVVDRPRPFRSHTQPLLVDDALASMDRWEELGSPTRRKNVPAGVATEKGEGSPCPTNLVSVHKTVSEADVMVSVDVVTPASPDYVNNRPQRTKIWGKNEKAKPDLWAETGLVLRFQDLQNYLVGIYNPTLKAIYFFERRNGSVMNFFTYRIPHLGMVDVPAIGNSFTLTAAACGEYVSMTIDDDTRSVYTPPVKVRNQDAGRIGLWRSDLGDAQEYRNVKVSKTPFAAPAPDEVPEGEHWIRRGEDVAPPVPSPQDWVMVLEKA